MSATYVIRWASKVNGRAGRGTKLFSQEEAEQLVQELNQEYPHILHEAIPAETLNRGSAPEHQEQSSGSEEAASDNEHIVSVE